MSFFQEITRFELGMNGGKAPRYLTEGEIAEAVNATARDLEWCCRPAAKQVDLNFLSKADSERFKKGRWQGMAAYQLSGRDDLYIHAHGSNFKINLATNSVEKKNAPSGASNPTVNRVNYVNHDKYLIRQDGQARPLLIDGNTVRNPTGSECPVGYHMASGNGYLIVSNKAGTGFNVSDYYNPDNSQYNPSFEGAPDGDPALTFEDQLNYYLGDTLFKPTNLSDLGPMTGMEFVNFGRSYPQLIVLFQRGAWIYDLSIPRQDWVSQPIGFPIPGFPGHSGSKNLAILNRGSDLVFRSSGQIMAFSDISRSPNEGVKHENHILSTPLRGWTDYSGETLEFAGYQDTFDRQLISTAQPHYHTVSNDFATYRQIVHEGLYIGDNEHQTDPQFADRLPKIIWSGMWQYPGRDVLGHVTVNSGGRERLFISMLNRETGENELWEQSRKLTGKMSAGVDTDNTGNETRIESTLTLPVSGMTTLEGQSGRGELKTIDRFHHWIKFFGDSQIATFYRWDDRESWVEWAIQKWETARDFCQLSVDEICAGLKNGQGRLSGRYLPHLSSLKQEKPSGSCDPITGKPIQIGRELQVKLKMLGSWSWRGTVIEAVKSGDVGDVEEYERISAGCGKGKMTIETNTYQD